MLSLCEIHRRASKDIYHDAEHRSLAEKSRVSFELDESLTAWQDALPAFLNIDKVSLSDPEWAYKQKLVLKMRKYTSIYTCPT